MEKNRVKQIHDYGQSIWLDFIDREIMTSGQLGRLISEDGVRGVTSNPAIFEKAINGSKDYQEDIRILSKQYRDAEDLFYQLAIKDIQAAADLFSPLYQEEVKGADGYVSLEVSPKLAMHTEETLAQARALWKAVGRKNVMIKIPGTQPGLAAIRDAIADGININVTLLFGLDRYKAVAEAYIEGLEQRVAAGKPVDDIASVASFFLSRIDVIIDPMLEKKGLKQLQGEVAIASAKKAYQLYQTIFQGPRWEALAAKGARPQRLLWASTSSKNPAFKATKYVDALIGKDTVNTVPLETIEAFRSEGTPAQTLDTDLDHAHAVLAQLKSAGIDLDAATQTLEDEGVEKFITPYNKLIHTIEEQVKSQ